MTMTAEQAIARSISHNEIVTLDYDADVYQELLDRVLEADNGIKSDWVDANEVTEFWGTTDDGDDWRVHMRHDDRLDRAQAALSASGWECSASSTETTLYIAVADEGGDDPSANEALEEIRAIVAEFGASAEWTGNGNTDADGSSTSDIAIAIGI